MTHPDKVAPRLVAKGLWSWESIRAVARNRLERDSDRRFGLQ